MGLELALGVAAGSGLCHCRRQPGTCYPDQECCSALHVDLILAGCAVLTDSF